MRGLLILAVAVYALLQATAKDIDVRDFGAVGDGKTFDTAAVQSAIDSCSAGGGGRVTLADGVFLVKPLMLKSGVELHLGRSARLLGSGDWRDYPNRGTLRHVDSAKLPRARDAALITADEAENIAITGGGTIDANGSSFVRPRPHSELERWHYERIGGFDRSPPRVVFFTGCRDITVRDVTMTNQPAGWSYWIHDCDRVVFNGCRVLADVHYPNNDGIHVNASRDVSISDCVIETGDDSIVIRANTRSLRERKPCERVTVSNCQLRSYANCIRLAWSMDGVIRNCTFSNLTMRDSNVGIGIRFVPRSWNPAGDYGVEPTLVENIVFSGIVMDRIHTCPIMAVIEPESERCEGMRNVSFANVLSSSGARPQFFGTPNTPLSDFSFVNCRFSLNDGPETLVPWTKAEMFAERLAETNSFRNCRGFSFASTSIGGKPVTATDAGHSPNDVYLLIGQSNMAGRGELTPTNRVSTDRVVKWDSAKEVWVEAVEPIVTDRDFSGAGLGATFARMLADADPGSVIGLVPAAEGNTALARWMPGADLYLRAVERTRAALAKGGVLRGILWHQGCADAAHLETVTNYAARLVTMVGSLRRDLRMPDVPFVAGELGRFLKDFRRPDGSMPPLATNGQLINAQLDAAVRMLPHAVLVSSEGLSSKPDRVHFDTPSLRLFGLRYAQALQNLRRSRAAANHFNVRDFGAKGDGVVKDTSALQAAIDAAERRGGGEVYLPAGTYLTGSIYLKDNVDFHVGAGARILGSPDPADYNRPDVCVQNNPRNVSESAFGAHLLLCIEKRNVTVRGPGTIDGNGDAFLLDPRTGLPWGHDRPGLGLTYPWIGQDRIPWRPSQMLYFVECENVRVEDLRLRNSTYWNCFLHGCENVQVRGLDIRNEKTRYHTHNGDGIDIDSCRQVSVSDCLIDVSDDCITLRNDVRRLKRKEDCAHVVIRNCVLSTPCNSLRVGVGNGKVHDIVVSGIAVHDTRTAISFVSSWATAAHGVDFENIRLSDWTVDCAEFVNMTPKYATSSLFKDLFITGFSGHAKKGGLIESTGNCKSENIVFSDIAIDAKIDLQGMNGVRIERSLLRK